MHIEVVVGKINKNNNLYIRECCNLQPHMTDTPSPSLNESLIATKGAVSSSQLYVCRKVKIIVLINS